jgi:hypothetical protein
VGGLSVESDVCHPVWSPRAGLEESVTDSGALLI